MPEPVRKGERVLRGIPVSNGVCRGKVLVLDRADDDSIPHQQLEEAGLPHQMSRFEQALATTRQQILEVQRQVSENLGLKDASIFDAHLLVLEDPILLEEVSRQVFSQKCNVEWAFHQFAEKYAAILAANEDEYLRERAADLRDVTARILNNLLGRSQHTALPELKEPCIIICHDLTPSRTATLDKQKVLGFATDVGSKTSHTAIMARSLRLPAVVGLRNASELLVTGEYVLLDGFNGQIIINPTDQTLFEYGQLVRKQVTIEQRLHEVKEQIAITLDGRRLTLSANVEQPDDTEAVIASGAEGVGLFRTEFLFINRENLPTEEEQFQSYRRVAAALKPQPVIIRTLDLGGDKFLSHLQVPKEMNPFLGWRAIRFCLQERDLFRRQLRAILRASVEGNVKMMYPMISGVEELDQANALVEECKAELAKEGVAFDAQIEIGVMIEIPSAVLAADALARRAKFFSLGTNDLIQYSLAVDRLNEKIAHLYQPTHPAILRLIKLTVDTGRQHGIWTGVCGEMASDPLMTPLLLGLGIDELSVAPPYVPQIKYLIRRLRHKEAVVLAESALQSESAAEILSRSEALVRQAAPGLFPSI